MLVNQPWIGASWEGFVIDQPLTLLAQRDHRAEAFFFRTSDQHEVDLVLEFGGRLWAIEIKLPRLRVPVTCGGCKRRPT